MHVAAFHQTKHLPRNPAHLQRLAIKRSFKRSERPHDIGDGSEAMFFGVGRFGLFRFEPDIGVCLAHHVFAKVHPDQVVLKNIVIEHELRGFTQIDDPFRERRRFDPVRHVLRVNGTCRVVIAANPANTAGDEMGVARVFAFHKDAVAAKDRRRAVTLRHCTPSEIDFRVDAQTPNDPGNGIPRHLHNITTLTHQTSPFALVAQHIPFNVQKHSCPKSPLAPPDHAQGMLFQRGETVIYRQFPPLKRGIKGDFLCGQNQNSTKTSILKSQKLQNMIDKSMFINGTCTYFGQQWFKSSNVQDQKPLNL